MWPEGLWRKPLAAKGFYAAIAIATAIGVVMNFSSINPIKALYWSQVINGIVAVPVMVLVMRVAADPKIMEKFAITGWLKFLGWGATGVMAAAVVGMGFASVI
jgi:Mn2+/Fe2+ NRAMP family transporter